ncbi:MAG TPA: molybdopterin-dependent oxidoreductase [Candidatus Binatia bacterium]|nr:molybdopterin-dependent oxidoreductase [Candidatus Binatia bacterium]
MAIQKLHTYCAMCISRCGVVATVEDGRLTQVNADPAHPNGCICVKGTAAPEIVYSPDRLRSPMKRTRPKGESDPGWAPLSWDDAMALTASRLLDVKARYGPEAVIFGMGTASGSSISDAARWLERLANAFGSPNLMAPLYICNWNREWGAHYTYGVATPPPDYDNSRCILLWGFNPHASWPAAAARISRAKASAAKLIVIDPRRSAVAEKADFWLRVRPGADRALAMSMIYVLLEEKLYDENFVRDWTNGAFLMRQDNHQLLTARDLLRSGDPETFLVWDNQTNHLATYGAEQGYARSGVVPALYGAHPITLISGKVVECRPAFDQLTKLASQYAPEGSEELTGVPAREVRRAARLFATEKPSSYYSWVGIELHSDASQTNRALCTFFALTGQFDQRGSNLLYATTPIQPITGQDLLPRELTSRRLGVTELPLGSPGHSGRVQARHAYHAILTGEPYPVKAMIGFGGDPVLANRDGQRGKAALEALDFYVHVDMFTNPSAAYADLLLPASTCWEREGLMPSFATAEETGTWVQLRPMVVKPLYESRSDLEIIFDLATRLGLSEQFFGGDIDAALNYHLAPSGITVERLRANRMGMRASTKTRYQKYLEVDAQTGRPRGFQTPTRKIEIYSTRFAKAGYAPLPGMKETDHSRPSETSDEYPLILTSFRLVQFCDQQHRNIPRLRRQAREPLLEIHPETATALNIQDQEWIRLETGAGSIRLKAKLNPSLHPKVVATQYGWWQGCNELGLPGYDAFGSQGANVNLLITNDRTDPISGAVPHRSQPCRVRKESGTD